VNKKCLVEFSETNCLYHVQSSSVADFVSHGASKLEIAVAIVRNECSGGPLDSIFLEQRRWTWPKYKVGVEIEASAAE
jgi:hypothetical protein